MCKIIHIWDILVPFPSPMQPLAPYKMFACPNTSLCSSQCRTTSRPLQGGVALEKKRDNEIFPTEICEQII